MDLNEIVVDVKKMEEGEWVPLTVFGDDVSVLLRSPECLDCKRAVARITASVGARQLRKDPDVMQRAVRRAIAEKCILDWKGIKQANQEVPWSRDKAIELMTEPRFVRFAEAVMVAANAIGEGDVEDLDDDAKNVPRRSDID